jgi:hypothetical protein
MTYMPPVSVPTPDIRWTTLQAPGALEPAVTDFEYDVSDHSHSGGRWTRTEEGERYAAESFAAHSHLAPAGGPVAGMSSPDPVRSIRKKDVKGASPRRASPFEVNCLQRGRKTHLFPGSANAAGSLSDCRRARTYRKTPWCPRTSRPSTLVPSSTTAAGGCVLSFYPGEMKCR